MISFELSILIALFGLAVVIVSLFVFARRLGPIEGLSPADKVAAWDVFTKAITTFAFIVAGLVAFVRYIDQRALELADANYSAAQKVREFNLGIYSRTESPKEAKRVLFNEVVDLVSSIATLDRLDTPTGAIAIDRFERLYHGQLVLCEGQNVSSAMIDFRDALEKWKRSKDGAKPTELLSEERTRGGDAKLALESKRNSDFMRQLALALSTACHIELSAIADDPKSRTRGAD